MTLVIDIGWQVRASLGGKIVRWVFPTESEMESRAKPAMQPVKGKSDEWDMGDCQSVKASWRRGGFGLVFTKKKMMRHAGVFLTLGYL